MPTRAATDRSAWVLGIGMARFSSAPKTVGSPNASAASANRATPYMPSWSVRASARRPSRTASSTSCSGSEAPSRKENEECACSSAYGTGSVWAAGRDGGW